MQLATTGHPTVLLYPPSPQQQHTHDDWSFRPAGIEVSHVARFDSYKLQNCNGCYVYTTLSSGNEACELQHVENWLAQCCSLGRMELYYCDSRIACTILLVHSQAIGSVTKPAGIQGGTHG